MIMRRVDGVDGARRVRCLVCAASCALPRPMLPCLARVRCLVWHCLLSHAAGAVADMREWAAQGGDIVNNNGTGADSIYGGIFEDECHNGWVKHSSSGLLAMANAGKNMNGQSLCPWSFLDRIVPFCACRLAGSKTHTLLCLLCLATFTLLMLGEAVGSWQWP